MAKVQRGSITSKPPVSRSTLPSYLVLILSAGIVIGNQGARLMSRDAFAPYIERFRFFSSHEERPIETETMPTLPNGAASENLLFIRNAIESGELLQRANLTLQNSLVTLPFEASLQNPDHREFFSKALAHVAQNPGLKGKELTETLDVGFLRPLIKEMRDKLNEAQIRLNLSPKELDNVMRANQELKSILDKEGLLYSDLVRAGILYSWAVTPETVLSNHSEFNHYDPFGPENSLFESMIGTGIESSQAPHLWYLPSFYTLSPLDQTFASGVGLSIMQLANPFEFQKFGNDNLSAFEVLYRDFKWSEELWGNLLSSKWNTEIKIASPEAQLTWITNLKTQMNQMQGDWKKLISNNQLLTENEKLLLDSIYQKYFYEDPKQFLFALTGTPHALDLKEISDSVLNPSGLGRFFSGKKLPNSGELKEAILIVRAFFSSQKNKFSTTLL